MTISEVRAMPIDEYESWLTYYKLEPWGWHDREYRTAVVLAQLWNVNASKKDQAKQERDYYRDMPSMYAKAFLEAQETRRLREIYLAASGEERKRMVARSLGARVRKVNIGGGS